MLYYVFLSFTFMVTTLKLCVFCQHVKTYFTHFTSMRIHWPITICKYTWIHQFMFENRCTNFELYFMSPIVFSDAKSEFCSHVNVTDNEQQQLDYSWAQIGRKEASTIEFKTRRGPTIFQPYLWLLPSSELGKD